LPPPYIRSIVGDFGGEYTLQPELRSAMPSLGIRGVIGNAFNYCNRGGSLPGGSVNEVKAIHAGCWYRMSPKAGWIDELQNLWNHREIEAIMTTIYCPCATIPFTTCDKPCENVGPTRGSKSRDHTRIQGPGIIRRSKATDQHEDPNPGTTRGSKVRESYGDRKRRTNTRIRIHMGTQSFTTFIHHDQHEGLIPRDLTRIPTKNKDKKRN
jgi:hypothetical protein